MAIFAGGLVAGLVASASLAMGPPSIGDPTAAPIMAPAAAPARGSGTWIPPHDPGPAKTQASPAKPTLQLSPRELRKGSVSETKALERDPNVPENKRRRLRSLRITRDIGIGLTAGGYIVNALGSLGYFTAASFGPNGSRDVWRGVGLLVPGVGPIVVGATLPDSPLTPLMVGFGAAQVVSMSMLIGGGVAHARLARQVNKERTWATRASFRVSPYVSPTTAGVGAMGRF